MLKPNKQPSKEKVMSSDRLLAKLILTIGLVFLAGCATDRSGESESLDPESNAPVGQGEYRIRRGDTLHSIAVRHGTDWPTLARLNGLSSPNAIQVGQVLRVSGQAPMRVAPATITNAPTRLDSSSTASRAAPPVPNSPLRVTPSSSPPPTGSGKWQWPTEGQVVAAFSTDNGLNKGVDISGQQGQPIVASQAGSVVYAGSGLRGYGELIIIKHNETYVSAYGHNSRLLVKEGQQVQAGQQIAEMGSSGTDRVKLHFEIRRQGKPVDPVQYLPRR